MPWWFAVAESKHELQNPTSPEKLRLLGERLSLGPESHVLDVASGRGGPAIVLAQAFGCRITCVERADEFVDVALERVRDAGLEHLRPLLASKPADSRS
jgi:cyclopropane fatty-acyl-phospholipid synthase-like methyltransferase